MSLKYGVLCVVLFVIVLLLAAKSYEALTHPIVLIPAKGAIKKSEEKTEKPSTMTGIKEPAPIASYNSIAEKNIFHPERKEFPILGGGTKKPIVRPQIVLYGVTLAGDYQSASVANPGMPLKKGERELMTVKVGNQVGEYKLAKILSDRITMEAEGDSFEVLLYDPRMPKKRMDVKTEAKPATITSTQPVPAPLKAGPPPPTVPTGGPVPASPPTSIGASKPTAPGEQVATPPPTIPFRPTIPSTDIRRERRPISNPSHSTPTQNMGGD
jgi:hypothetical protein